MISNNVKLSVIMHCHHRILTISELASLQGELTQHDSCHEVILLTSGKTYSPCEGNFQNIRMIQVSSRSDLDGCWQAGIQAATHDKIALIDHYHPGLLNQHLDPIMKLQHSPSNHLVFPQQLHFYIKWFAISNLLNHRYHKLMANISICGFNRSYLLFMQQQTWYKKLLHHFFHKSLSSVHPPLGSVDLYH